MLTNDFIYVIITMEIKLKDKKLEKFENTPNPQQSIRFSENEINLLKEIETEAKKNKRSIAAQMKLGYENYIKKKSFIKLGIFQSKSRILYDCVYWTKDEIAEAIGPLPRTGEGGRCVSAAYTVDAKDPSEAKEKLAEAIGKGEFL